MNERKKKNDWTMKKYEKLLINDWIYNNVFFSQAVGQMKIKMNIFKS